MRSVPLGFAAGLAVLLAACAPVSSGSATPSANAPLRDEGRQLAGLMCARCHAIGVDGRSANSLAPPFRFLGQRYGPADLKLVVNEQLIARHPVMPTYRLTPAQRDALNAYIASVQRPAES
jgi:cytochrome c